jgi:hypothetical protein
MKWIKCSEQLPKNSDPVLVFSREGCGSPIISASYFIDDDYWRNNVCCGDNLYVTHWMLLPLAPNEEK